MVVVLFRVLKKAALIATCDIIQQLESRREWGRKIV
jgi:hypothetical protein